jgi:hypothetical protein
MLNIISKQGTHGAICQYIECKLPYSVKDRFVSAKVHAGDQWDTCHGDVLC